MTATLKTTIIQEPSSATANIQLGASGQVGFGGANYGANGQVLASGGPSSAPAWRSLPSLHVDIFASSTTWVCPPGVVGVIATVIGGGGGGGSATGGAGATNGGSGGFGGFAIAECTVTPGTSYTITVGAGGAGNNGGTGSAGSTSSFDSLVSATGGAGGITGGGDSSYATSGTGTVTTGTTLRIGNISTSGATPTAVGGFTNRLRGAGLSSAIAWSTSSIFSSGAVGNGESTGDGNNAAGGVGGIVMLEYVS